MSKEDLSTVAADASELSDLLQQDKRESQLENMSTVASDTSALFGDDNDDLEPATMAMDMSAIFDEPSSSSPPADEPATMAMDTASLGLDAPSRAARQSGHLQNTLAATADDFLREEKEKSIRTGYAVETEAIDHDALFGKDDVPDKPRARVHAPNQGLETMKADHSLLAGPDASSSSHTTLYILAGAVILVALVGVLIAVL